MVKATMIVAFDLEGTLVDGELFPYIGGHPVIITGGFAELADRVAAKLGVEYVACNRLMVEDGVVVGVQTPILTREGKRDRLEALSNWLGVPLNRCVAIGDGSNDVPMLKAAGLGIGFGNRECVNVADCVVNTGTLADAIPHIRKHLTLTRTHNLSHSTTVTIP